MIDGDQWILAISSFVWGMFSSPRSVESNEKGCCVVHPLSLEVKRERVPRTEVQFAHESGLLDLANFHLDLV